MSEPLMPCPFCGGGETRIEENRLNRAPMMSGKESPVISVEIRHWCPPQQGQPRRNHVVKVGRDMNSAIAAWNRRATPAEVDALRAEASEWCQKAQLFEDRITRLRAELAAARGALKDATAHLFGAAAAYRKYGRQHKVRGPADPFYTTRANDFDRAAERARAATREPLLAALGDTA